MPGLLSPKRSPGLLERPYARQVSMPGMQPQGAGWMMAGGGPGMGQGGGIDPRDAPGTGVSIWRELMRGLSQHGIGALSPDIAGKVFSPENRAMLAPQYQKKGKT